MSSGNMTHACFKHNALKQTPRETTPTSAALLLPPKDCDGFDNGVHDYVTGSKGAVRRGHGPAACIHTLVMDLQGSLEKGELFCEGELLWPLGAACQEGPEY